MDPATGCPNDYDELYRAYYPLILFVVQKSGIVKDDVEDVAMEILVKFIERNGIAYYDPGYVMDTGARPEVAGPRYRRTTFRRMIYGFASTYVLALRDKQMGRHTREVYCLDAPVAETEAVLGDHLLVQPEPTGEIDTRLAVGSALPRAARLVQKTRGTPVRDYRKFCVEYLREYEATGKAPKRKHMSDRLGVSPQTYRSMVQDFQSTLRHTLVKEGVSVT